jgi:hypothetical protein
MHMILVYLGFALLVGAVFWTWFLAFKTSILWGIATIFLFPAGTSWFIILHRPKTTKIIVTTIAAVLLMLLGAIIGQSAT